MKTIIACPNCRHKMRIPFNKHIRFNCASCQTLIEANQGKIISHLKTDFNQTANNFGRQTHHIKQSSPRNNRKIVVSKKAKQLILAALVLVLGAFGFVHYQQQKWDYEKVLERPTIQKWEDYLRKYPNGRYAEKATFFRDSSSVERAYIFWKETCEYSTCECYKLESLVKQTLVYKENQVDSLYESCLLQRATETNMFADFKKYMTHFPNGNYADSIVNLEKQAWASLNAAYLTRAREKGVSAKGREFISALLDYGQQTRQQRIQIVFNSTLKLKDWEDYPQDVREQTDVLSMFSNVQNKTNFPTPSNSPPPSIKKTMRNQTEFLQKRIVDALQMRLNKVLSPNPFTIEAFSNTEITTTLPKITINYNIETLTDDYELKNNKMNQIPTLYVHTQTQYSKYESHDKDNILNGRFIGYLLATGIQWDMQFEIPNSEIDFTMETYSRPNSQFRNTRNNSDAYARMLKSAFENYAVSIAEGVGL